MLIKNVAYCVNVLCFLAPRGKKLQKKLEPWTGNTCQVFSNNVQDTVMVFKYPLYGIFKYPLYGRGRRLVCVWGGGGGGGACMCV